MSNNRLQLQGLEELRAALRKLPSELKAEARHIVDGAANGAAADIKAAYPVRTGNLRDGVSVEHTDPSTFAAGAIVKNKSKHAWIFENGTQARHNALGANRGAMPPGRVFIPTVIKKRRQMQDKLIDLVKRQGLQVTGG